ncbi:MAG: hypothetical protein A2622_04250 [Bdellovibrionales bacterium RIFCSPHIGHO2_01_FULL_40_29]|nr:MAG: hypothetical protein A2622_04250 [Bdellovibrionales bacterium RIFCSPHIGHO2_01_FULL_40_29]OFZ34850.1 MAG: hypothetical protein A3D17_11125 [Bdellovibrionales bacterium RIFCSPHIGHO2_02_FULL_40_15]
MRKYSDYINQEPTLEDKAFIAARKGDENFFTTLPATTRQEVLALVNSRGYSVLMLAAYHGHTDLVKTFLSWGANPNDTDFGGNSVLMGVCFKGHTNIISLLLSAGANPELKNEKGQTAILFAQMFGRQEALILLQSQIPATSLGKFKAWMSFLKLNYNNERKNHV